MLFTEARPTLTGTRVAPLPSGVHLEQAQRGVFVAQRRTAYVKHIGHPFQVDGSIHAQVGPGALRKRPGKLYVNRDRSVLYGGIDSLHAAGITPLWVSIEAGWPIWMSRAWVSAIFSAAFNWSGCTTLASVMPGATCSPTWCGRSTSTPEMPAVTWSAAVAPA